MIEVYRSTHCGWQINIGYMPHRRFHENESNIRNREKEPECDLLRLIYLQLKWVNRVVAHATRTVDNHIRQFGRMQKMIMFTKRQIKEHDGLKRIDAQKSMIHLTCADGFVCMLAKMGEGNELFDWAEVFHEDMV